MFCPKQNTLTCVRLIHVFEIERVQSPECWCYVRQTDVLLWSVFGRDRRPWQMMVWLVCWLAGSLAWVGFGRLFFGVGGGVAGRNWKRILEKTRVGFGGTGVSVRLDGIVFCALSSGHGPRGRGFPGVWKSLDFHDFLLEGPK